MNELLCLSNLTELDWMAIGSLATFLLAIAAFITLYIQGWQFRKMRADENERAFKNSSVQLIIDFDKGFLDLQEFRKEASKLIIEHKILEGKEIKNYSAFKNGLEEIYDFFDTLGFYIAEEYIKADIVHQYFDYWFGNYYEFYKQYNVKQLSGYEATVWGNLSTLAKKLDEVEVKKLGKQKEKISKTMLVEFFTDESEL